MGLKRPDRIRFKTETGSVYEINYQLGTWKRESTTPESGTIRAEGGTLVTTYDDHTRTVAIGIGCRAVMYDTSVLPGHEAHAVMTSRVTEILEIDPADDGPEVDVFDNERLFPGEETPGVPVHLGGGFNVVTELVDEVESNG